MSKLYLQNIINDIPFETLLMEGGLLCEVSYSKTPENLKHWIFFRPTYYKDVSFLPPEVKNKSKEGG